MKNYILFGAAAVLLFATSCKKTVDKAVDCFGESLLVGLSSTSDTSNSKMIHFEATYMGDKTVKSVDWTYGDGSTGNTTTLKSSHTYTNTGSFKAKAKINISVDGETCSPEPEVTVNIN